jgi:hypothetical protein
LVIKGSTDETPEKNRKYGKGKDPLLVNIAGSTMQWPIFSTPCWKTLEQGFCQVNIG